jgi:uncharacterized protein (TIGR02118 family)
MFKLVLLFENATKTDQFDLRYRRNVALLRKLPGVVRIDEGAITGSPGGQPRFHRVVEVVFETFDALDAALTSPEGVAAGKDLMDFAGTGVELLFVTEEDAGEVHPLAPKNVQAYLDNFEIPAEIVYPGAPTPTVPAAAAALGVAANQIVKSVVFLVEERPFLVYGCGTRRVDSRKLAARLNVNRKHVKLANADQVLDLTGYAIGTVPPLGLKTPMPAFMDPAILDHEVIYAGGGGINALLKIASAELLRATNAEVAPMLEDAETGASSPEEPGAEQAES